MPYDLTNRLVVGVSSSALFDLKESDAYFQEHGVGAYREYQDEHIDDTLRPGVAFPFIKMLLQLNDLRPDDPLVEVIVLSRNDPSTGLRVMRSVEKHGLSISRAVFTQGKAPYEYIGALQRKWGVNVSDAFFLGGIEKAKVLQVMRPHIFFDDQATHLDGAARFVAGVHIPYGVANTARSAS